MKKTVITLGAILAFGIASAQTDTTRTKADRDRVKIEKERNKTVHTTKTPEERKDEAKKADTKADMESRIPTPPPTPPKPPVPPVPPEKTKRPVPPPGIPEKQ